MIRCITSLTAVLQTLLLSDADELARITGLVRRARKLDGSTLAQTLVLGWLDHPHATVEQLTAFADAGGSDFSAEALRQRLRCPQAVDFFEQLLSQTLSYSCQASTEVGPLLDRFEGVYVFDTTRQALPDVLAGEFPGQGGTTAADGCAACTIQVCLELSGQGIVELQLGNGRTNDLSFELAHTGLPPGCLRLADRGFIDLGLFADYNDAGVFWLCRLHPGIWVADDQGRRAKPHEYLQSQDGILVDRPVYLGAQRLPARLVAQRLSEEAAARRRQQLRRKRQQKGEAVSAAALALCDWDVTISNVPAAKLSAAEVLALRRLRWQVELLFKLWKSAAALKRIGGQKRERILVELLAKLIGQVVQSWQLLVSGCSLLRYSWYRCAKVLQGKWVWVLLNLKDAAALRQVLAAVARRLLRTCQKRKRARRPAAFEVVEDPEWAQRAQAGAYAWK